VKWKFNEIDKAPELSPDLEWMLQSGQVSRQLLLEKLAEAFYPYVYRLAISLTGDLSATRSIVREVFSYLVLNPHRYRSQIKVEIWVHQNAYRIIMGTLNRERFWRGLEWWTASPGQFTNPLSVEPKDELDRSIWRKLDLLDEEKRTTLILRYGNSWEIPYISQITGVGEDVIDKRIKDGLDVLADQTALPREGLAPKLSVSLNTRYSVSGAGESQLFIKQMEKQTRHRFMLRGGLATVRELMLVGLAILLVLLAIWGGNRYLFGGELSPLSAGSQESGPQMGDSRSDSSQQSGVETPTAVQGNLQAAATAGSGDPPSTPTPEGVFYYAAQGDSLASIAGDLGVSQEELRRFNRLPDGIDLVAGQALVIPGSVPNTRQLQATPVTPVARTRLSSPPISSGDVLNLLNPDELPYHSLWVSAVVKSHDPSAPDSVSNISKLQLWISPRQFLLLGGEMGEQPQEVGIGMRRRFYVARPGHGQPWFHPVNSGFSNPFQDSTLLYGLYMLFGEIGELATSDFMLLGKSIIAGRDAWVVSQLNFDNERIGLLYIDEQTGFILRYHTLTAPEFSAEAGIFMPDEVEVNAVEFDIDIPQELFELSLPWRGGYFADHTGQPSLPGEIEPEPAVLSLDYSDRAQEPPDGYDPTKGRLDFRFPIGRYKYLSMAGTDIYADGFFLGRVDMGIPWNITCQRSSDGQVLVYRTATSNKDDIISLSNGPYYLRLSKPLEIRRVLPGASRASSDFAISPDSRYVAVWACERNKEPCGVYLHDLENHTWRRLVDIQDGAGGFVWSLQGDQLAMLTAGNDIVVVDIMDGELLYTAEYDSSSQVPPQGTPMDDWGIEFPSRPQGLEACINPP